MRVIVYDNSGHPFQVQLSRALSTQGFEVLHLYSVSFQTPKGKLSKQPNDSPRLTIKGVSLSEKFTKYSFIKRRRQETQFGKFINAEIDAYGPDVLIASNVPLDTLKIIQRHCAERNIRFIVWVQDFYGVAIKRILRSKFPIIGWLIGSYYERLERRIIRSSERVILISEDFVHVISKMGIESSKVRVVPNWAPLDELPVQSKSNSWSREYGLDHKFCFVYSGTLGLKHNPDLLLELALHFRPHNDVRIIVISEGLGAELLLRKQKELGLDNLMLMNFQPFELLPKILGTAEVLIAVLEKDAGVYSVPSKVLSYLCAQRALLLAVPAENLAARMVSIRQMGLVTSPDDKFGFVGAAMRFYMDASLRSSTAESARKYAEEEFQIDKISKQFIQMINDH